MAVPLSSTKHFKVTQQLRQKVGELEPGEVLPTHRSLMQEFDASQSTIDRALTTLRREGLVYRRDGSKRLIVREVMENVALRVGIVRPDWPSGVYDMICRGITQIGHQKEWLFEYSFYRTMSGLDLTHALEDCQAGVILTTSEEMPEHMLKVFESSRLPLVMVQDHRPGANVNCVCIDDRQMASAAMNHMLEQGHRRILLVAPCVRTGPMRDCIDGWRQELTMAGEGQIDELLVDCQTPSGKDTRQHCYDFFKHYMTHQHPPFSAVYCANSQVMFSVMRVFNELQIKIPEQVSVMTADSRDEDAAYQVPPVSALTYDPAAQAQAVIRLIEQQVKEHSRNPREVWIQGFIHHRQSVAPFHGNMI
jgi:LacI family transcriptional regulator